ncbi:MAG TPA: response regulator [Spirochaetota bacterium]|nr:response regulator [Spirochaetota bacterium]HPC43138.1 response regulator [Spirochaetota bacterium]HPL17364.1 response regulator [Spirochaetota bacterium]HQF10509.1 response regulator [Spirochaetota bacterium]HQH99516.1 response regulator [Spirochaetota bacterium]
MTKKNVMIVEDEVIIALELEMILERAGYAVTHISYTAEDAMKYAEADRPDIIIMDVMLRDNGSGIDAAERINGMFAVPVLFITGNRKLIDENSLKNTSSYYVMSKPPCENDIIKNVKMLVGD